MLKERAPDIEKILAADHHEIHPMYDVLDDAVSKFERPASPERVVACEQLQDTWNHFIGNYSAHMQREETEALSMWHEHFTDAEIMETMGKGQRAIPPEVMGGLVPIFLYSINVGEAAVMYTHVKTNAPPPAVEGFEKAALSILGEGRWATAQAYAKQMAGG